MGGAIPAEILLKATDLRKSYPAGRGVSNAHHGDTKALDGVSLEVRRGETLGIAGESGCGKTTLARVLLRLVEPDEGEIEFLGKDWIALRGGELRAMRREMQMIFQDAASSLNPRIRSGRLIEEPLEIHEPNLSRDERRERVLGILSAVGLREDVLACYPHEFSGGQRQRLAIARALILHPTMVIADEPVSALDVSVGAQILELLARLQRELGLTLILITHSLPVVAQIAARVAVMSAGKIVEEGEVRQLFAQPTHACTRELLAAVPSLPEI
jgi:oligopeptide transport system ATP-binding protein